MKRCRASFLIEENLSKLFVPINCQGDEFAQTLRSIYMLSFRSKNIEIAV